MAEKFVIIKEVDAPSLYPWRIELHSFQVPQGETRVAVAVRGERGGLKARLYVKLADLKEAVSNLED